MKCHGEEWVIDCFPGGDEDSRPGRIAAFLHCITASRGRYELKAKCSLNGKRTEDNTFGDVGFGYSDIAKRETVGQDFHVDAIIELCALPDRIWKPSNKLCHDMLKLLEAAKDNGNVSFRVGREGVLFAAHKEILQIRAPTLAILAQQATDTDLPIAIEGMSPVTFDTMLRFLYANATPKEGHITASEALLLLDAANLYGCPDLKLYAEFEVLKTGGITVDTVADLILKADGMNCAFLKEQAIEFFANNAPAVMKTPGWRKMTESAAVLAEVMQISMGNMGPIVSHVDIGDMSLDRMTVSSLRRHLDARGKDVDGSKEMLISRLEALRREDLEGTELDLDADMAGAEEEGDADDSDMEDE